jgi:hypothetical protein
VLHSGDHLLEALLGVGEDSGLELAREDIAHRVGGAPCRGLVVVGVALKGERGGCVPGESLEVPDRLATLGEQAKAGVP